VAAAGCDLQEHPNQDIWMQDCMEWGYSSLPTGVGFRTVIRAPRDYDWPDLREFPETLRSIDLGYYTVGTPEFSTVNSLGNLEVSPPVTSKAGKEYPWGRMYYGHTTVEAILNGDLEEFLNAQKVQEPVPIDTSWLHVKHVDEIMSFVPSNGGRKGFKLLLASPALGYEILKNNRARNASAKMLARRRYSHPVIGLEAEVTIEDFLTDGLTSLDTRLTSNHLESYNRAKQSDITRIRKGVLEIEFGVDDSDIIEVPLIFADIEDPPFADALTANMVNMLVLGRHCIFPIPYGPVVGSNDLFQVYLEHKLKAEGLIPCPIDDWYEYHVNLGEVHCGTNTLRIPKFAKWWEFER
jgi:protein-arginine deiminase